MARVFLTVALGPTVGTAKSRVIVGIDGLETKVWGLREATIPNNVTQTGDVSEEDEGDVNPSKDESDTEDEDEQSEDGESGVNSEEEEDLCGSDDDPSTPPSRSPSPSPSSDSEASQSTLPQDVKSMSPSPQTEDPETVRAAERLLSRTLASACAEDDDYGLACDMGKPNHIHTAPPPIPS